MTTNLLNNLSNVLKKGPSETQKNPLSCEAQSAAEKSNRVLITCLSRVNLLIKVRCMRYAALLLVLLLAGIGNAWGAMELANINFKSWTPQSISAGSTVNGCYFKSAVTITAADGATFAGNATTSSNWVAIPLSGINGSITITLTHASSRPQWKNYFKGLNAAPSSSDLSSNPSSVGDNTRPGSNTTTSSWTINTDKLYGVFYVGKGSNGLNDIYSITITTPDWTYYYRGADNSWGADAMTKSSEGFYSYKSSSTNDHQFKIAKSTSSWDYNYSFVDAGYLGTSITTISSGDNNNCHISSAPASYYIIVFRPGSAMNTTANPKICASATLPAEKFTISFNNGGGSGSMSSISNVVYGSEKATTANTFTKSGYRFTGWHANVDVKVGGATKTAGTLLDDEVTIQEIKSDITLTAQWEVDDGCDKIFWFANSADATTNGVTNNTTTFSGVDAGTSGVSGSITIDGKTYTATGRGSNNSNAITFTVPANKVGTLYGLANSSGSSARTLTLTNTDSYSETQSTSASSSTAGAFTFEDMPAGSYSLAWSGNGAENMLCLKLCDAPAGCDATQPGALSKGTLSGCSRTITASGSAATNNTWYWQSSASGTDKSDAYSSGKAITEAGTYYLRSFCSDGAGCWSDAVQVTITAADMTPAAPTALAAASPTAKGVTLTVTDAANTNDYEFYVNTSSSAPSAGTSASYTSTSKSVTITDKYAGTTFYAWARAKCGSNKSAWTALGDGGTFTTSTVTVTHTLTNVTKTSGATTAGGSDYTAEFAAVSGYSLPSPVVTIGGNSATSGTDYTWTVGTGTLTIPAGKINGDIAITINSAVAAPSSVAISGDWLYFAGETIELTATPTGGNGPVTYQWYKGGKADGNAIEGATSATYSKASCAYEDAGSYYCKVTCGGSASTWGQSGDAYDVKIPRLYVKTGHNYDLEKPDYGNVDFTRATASTATASISLGSNWDYCFNIADGCGHYYGNAGTMQYNNYGPWTTNVNNQDCGLRTTNGATYVFTINYSNWTELKTTVTFPSSNQAADKVIYFDNSERQWTNVYYRIGHTTHVQASAMDKVYGTANLYTFTTTEYNNFMGWHITNATGETGSNTNIYNTVNSPAITYATAHEGGAVTQSAVTVTPTTSRGEGGDAGINDNCEFYNYTITNGMKTQNVAISDYSNGTITVNYVNTSNEAATLTSGNADLAHSVILTSITAVPNTGYDASAITINGGAYSANYVVTGATTIAATFTPHVYNITYKDQGDVAFSGTHVDSPNAHPTTHTYATATTLNSATKTGYTFGGWFTNSACTGDAVASLGATDYTADITLYAKWTALPLVTWTMNVTTSAEWETTATSTSDGTNISSIGTSHDEGDNSAKNSATPKTALASGEVTDSSEPSNSARFTFTIANTKQVEITKLDCKVFNVGGDNDGQTTYKAQISDAYGNVYNSTNTICPASDAILTPVSFVFGSSKILRGAVTIKVYGWVSGSGSFSDFRMGPDIKFYGTVDDYVCAAPAAPTISGTDTYTANGDNISLTASCASGTDASTTYTWYKGSDWATASAASPVQTAKTAAEGGTTFTKEAYDGDGGTYWCEASNGSGCEAHNSTGYAITVNCPAIGTPTTPTIEDLNATGATLGWDPSGMVSGALGYQVSIVVTSTSAEVVAWTSEGITNDRTYTVSGLTEGVGYTFKVRGWSNGCVGSASSVDFTPTATITYTVTFNSNGGSAVSPITQASEDASIAKPSDPTRASYEFDGWYATAGEKISWPYTPTADITLYARWEEECDAEGVAKSTTDVAASGYTTYIEKGGDKVVFTDAPTLGFKYKDADGNTINSSTTAVVRNNAYKCQISSDSGNKGSIKTNNAFSNVDSISFYFAASDKTGCKIAVWCSTDNFSADSTSLLSATTYADNNSEFKLKTLAIPSDKKASALRFKFRFTVTSSGKTSYIDSLKVYSSTSGGGTCYHVYYHGNGAESGFVSDTTSYSDGAKATVLSYNDSRYPLTREGYDFQGWATSAGGSAAYSDGEKITIDGADVHLYAKWAAETDALVTWTMNTNTGTWGASATSTTDGTNIGSIATERTAGGSGNYSGVTAKVTMATAEVTGSAAPSNSANFTFTIKSSTKQVEISKFDCKVFNVSSGGRTYKAQISDEAGNVYNSTNTVAVSAEATLTDASFVFGSGKILRGDVTIRIYAWKTSGSPTEFRMGPDVKFYGTVEDYECATPSAPTISGVSEYVPGQTITLTASHDGENYDNLTTYTWYKGADWATASGTTPVQAAGTGSAGYTFTKASCAAGDAGKYWCEVANGTCNAHNSEGYNIIVYPTYSITYNLNGGTNPVDPAPKTSYTQFDEDYTLPIPTKDGFVFAGWYEASDFSGLPTSLIETNSIGDKSFYAKWGSAVTATWTVTKVDDKLYRGGGGYSVKAVIDQTAWNDSYKDQLELTATEGVTLKNIVASVVSSHVQVTADFDITTGLAADATEITFTLDVPADGTYAPAELTHDEALADCSGGVVEVRFLSSEKNDAGENFADMDDGSSQLVGNGLAKMIATNTAGLNDANNKIGYRADRVNVVFKLLTTSDLDIYFNANSTGKSFTLYSFSSAKELSAIETSDYSSKTKITSVTAVGAAFASSGKSTSAGVASVSSGVVNITTAGGIKATYASLAAGYYVLIGSSDGYFYGFDVDGGAGGGGPVTPTLSWTPALESDAAWNSTESRLDKETGDADFTFTASTTSNTLGTITYSSSNTSVATVNATSGKVHIVGAEGTATITATLAASGCFDKATATYEIHVVDNCIDEPGTISATDLGCSGIQMTVSGHTTSGETVSYQWYKVGSPDTQVGTNSDTYTTSTAGEYYVVVTNTGTDHCAMASTNTVKVASKAAATATKIVDSWYVKNGRRTPDVALVQTTGATDFIVKNGETPIWNSDSTTTTGFGGCGFHMGTDGIIYLNGTKDNGDATTGLTAGDVTLKITANDGCGSSASELSITIHCQEATIYKEIAFVVDGDKGKGFDQVTSGHADGTELYEYLDSVGTAAGKRLFRLTEQNIYSTTDEKAIRQHYSQYDAILITDDPSTNKVPNKEDYKTGGYVNAFGTMIDVRPILTMEAYVSALKNWGSKGIAGNPQSPNPRQYEMRLECKDHEIYGAGLPDPEDGTNVWEEVIDGETFRHVILVDSTQGIYNGVAYNVETKGNEKPALQGFTGEAAGSLLGLGRILEGRLQAAIERQEEPAARLLVFGINAKALHETCALTDEGKTVIKNILVYLLKTNMEEVDDCSNYFTGKIDNDWSKAGNWSKSALPSTEAKVRILAPCVVSGSQPHVAQVAIVSSGKSSIRETATGSANCNGSLTINANGALIVEGEVLAAEAPHFAHNDLKPTTVNDLIINTSSTNQAALIFNNDEGKTQATVNLYSLGRTVSETNQFQYFAIPMSYLSVNPTFANETHGITIYTYVWLEATGWERRGYYTDLYAFEGIGITTDKTTAHEYTMKGTLASTKDQEIPITADGKKLNLIGNSWTAPIQISELEASDFGDASSAVEQTVYIYCTGHGKATADGSTEAAGQWLAIPFNATDFAAWEGLKVIPSMQSFQIKTSGAGTLTLDYKKHVRGGTTTLTEKLRAPKRKVETDGVELMRIRVADSQTHTDLYLFEGDQFTDEFDNGWEANYRVGTSESAKLYARVATGVMSVAAMPSLESTPVYFIPGQETEYMFTFGGEGMGYYLNDIKMQRSTLISTEATYSFTYEKGDAAARFYISKTPIDAGDTPTGWEGPSDQVKAQKIIYDNKLYIIVNGTLYDATGKKVNSK